MQPALFRFSPPAWLVLWVCALLWAIFQHGPLPLYSTRTLGVAWEMWNQGTFLVPHTNGAPYSHKVPLLFWLIHAGWAAFGVNDVWPRILQVLIAAAWLFISARLAQAASIGKPSAASLVPWLLIALPYPFLFSLQIMYEVLLALCVAAALCALTERPRWHWFALAIGAGLLTKGPVMLLHVVFPWLLGPWWSEAARSNRRHWYGSGLLAIAGGIALLLAWAVPAGFAGGEDYRRELFFLQTAGRVVASFDHARPVFWYLPMLLVLMLPWVAWPRVWQALATARGPMTDSERFAVSWVVPTFVVFCLISGKQVYYLLPLLPGMTMLLAAALRRQQSRMLGNGRRWRAWPVAAALIGIALLLAALPIWRAHAADVPHWVADTYATAPWFAAGFLALGVVCLLGDSRHELQRIAVCALLGIALVHTVFAGSLFHHFDLRPAAAVLARVEADGRPIANVGRYEAQYHFLARLNRPLAEIESHDVAAWAKANPDGVIVRYPASTEPANEKAALLVQPFRTRWIEIWEAQTLATAMMAASASDETTTQPPEE
jgi:4-amino-4-deoxy-L-arabinose transferase-like glycosyltransferase